MDLMLILIMKINWKERGKKNTNIITEVQRKH